MAGSTWASTGRRCWSTSRASSAACGAACACPAMSRRCWPRRKARVCRHSFEGEEGGDEMEGGGVAGVGFVVASGDAAELLDLLEEVLDQVAPFVDLGVIGDGAGPAAVGRDDGQRTAVVQLGPQGICCRTP